jgi:anti-sigma regulatory factor (Ser/Thr protein kinase)
MGSTYPEVARQRDLWPLMSRLELAALPEAVPSARSHARDVLREWGMSELVADAELLLSELATNALRASEPLGLPVRPPDEWMAEIGICLLADGARLRIEVWDQAAGFPVLQETSNEAECMTTTGTDIAPTAASVGTETRFRELIAPSLFSKLACRVAAVDGYDQGTAERIVEQALAFLVACARYPDGHLSPSETVDAGWHAFILHTVDYAEFCQRVTGRFIHHRPNAPGEATSEQQAIGVTIAAMRAAGCPWIRTFGCPERSARSATRAAPMTRREPDQWTSSSGNPSRPTAWQPLRR